MMSDPEPSDHEPTQPRHALSGSRRDDTPAADDDGVLQNEYAGQADRDGIPANGTAPAKPRGPDDVGA